MSLTVPKFIKTAFAKLGLKTDIPDASNNVTGRAGYDAGFPEINMAPIEAGGIPPNGTDMNGILYDITQAIQYIQAGKRFPYNSAFATAIGGYDVGAIVSDDSGASVWINGTANNTSSPSVANGWTNLVFGDPSETVRGTPYSASQAEINTGANVEKTVTPGRLRFGVSMSLGPNGYIFLPSWLGGLCFQWMRLTFDTYDNGGGIYISPICNWPTPFPNAIYQAFSTHIGLSPVDTMAIFDQGYLTSSQFLIRTKYTSGNASWMFFAIGK